VDCAAMRRSTEERAGDGVVLVEGADLDEIEHFEA
jgi:hypothetical protein